MDNHLLNARFADPVATNTGRLQCSIFGVNVGTPIVDARITITKTGTSEIIEQIITDSSGKTVEIDLPAPPIEYSLDENSTEKPYSEYDVKVEAPDFETTLIEGIQILPTVTALQNVDMPSQITPTRQENIIIISPHTLWGSYPPKIPEAEEKPMPEETGFVVLDKPVIPEFIIVHDGSPEPNIKLPQLF